MKKTLFLYSLITIGLGEPNQHNWLDNVNDLQKPAMPKTVIYMGLEKKYTLHWVMKVGITVRVSGN